MARLRRRPQRGFGLAIPTEPTTGGVEGCGPELWRKIHPATLHPPQSLVHWPPWMTKRARAFCAPHRLWGKGGYHTVSCSLNCTLKASFCLSFIWFCCSPIKTARFLSPNLPFVVGREQPVVRLLLRLERNLVSWHHSRMAGQAMWVVPFRGTNRLKHSSWNLPENANFAEAPQQRQFIE